MKTATTERAQHNFFMNTLKKWFRYPNKRILRLNEAQTSDKMIRYE